MLAQLLDVVLGELLSSLGEESGLELFEVRFEAILNDLFATVGSFGSAFLAVSFHSCVFSASVPRAAWRPR